MYILQKSTHLTISAKGRYIKLNRAFKVILIGADVTNRNPERCVVVMYVQLMPTLFLKLIATGKRQIRRFQPSHSTPV